MRHITTTSHEAKLGSWTFKWSDRDGERTLIKLMVDNPTRDDVYLGSYEAEDLITLRALLHELTEVLNA